MSKRILALFDVDGTLTEPRKTVSPEMIQALAALREKITIGVVGGSDLSKQKEQLGQDATERFDYNFAENGLVGFKSGTLINETSLLDFIGNEKLTSFVNYVLGYLAKVDIPKKRGTFIEYRKGMLNISPIGRNCSQLEREEFEQYDKVHKVRQHMVEQLKNEFSDMNLQFSIGGQISFDVFPKGWDKTYCLQFLSASDFDEIHFFGDKTYEGGNDYEIFTHERTIGHHVNSPGETLELLKTLFP